MEKDIEVQLVEKIVKAIVDNPDKVNLTVINGEKSTILEVSVSPGDIGKVIGKYGRIAEAIRVILNARARKVGKRMMLEILDPERQR